LIEYYKTQDNINEYNTAIVKLVMIVFVGITLMLQMRNRRKNSEKSVVETNVKNFLSQSLKNVLSQSLKNDSLSILKASIFPHGRSLNQTETV